MTKLDLTKPVQTRDGRKVRILCTDAQSRQSVIGLITNHQTGTEELCRWGLDGGYKYSGAGPNEPNDLVNTPNSPTYRPWTAAEAAEHVGEKVKAKNGEILSSIIIRVDSYGAVYVGALIRTATEMSLFYTFLDGSPCGQKVD